LTTACWTLALLAICIGAGLASPCSSQETTVETPKQERGFDLSFVAGSQDAAGHLMGGSEIHTLVTHAGKLFAGDSYWMNQPGPEGFQDAQILVLDRPGGRWRVDHAFEGWLPNGRPRHLAVGAMREVTFETDGNGKALARPVPILLASTWEITDEDKVFARDDATGNWIGTILARREEAPGARRPRLTQIRSFGFHRDRVTGVDLAFAGQRPQGIFSGVYDPAAEGRIHWSKTPELDVSSISQAEFRGMEGRVRVTSFAECNGRLYAAVGQQIYERVDGPAPQWRLIYANSSSGYSQTGLRGLTAIPSPTGQGQVLIAGIEGVTPRIVRIDPRDGSETTELDLRDYLGRKWGMGIRYAIAGYNDMTEVRDVNGEQVLLIGVEAVVIPGPQAAADHQFFDIRSGRVVEGGAWYLIRRSNGNYDLRRIPALTGQPMVAVRSIIASPFASESGVLYFAGFDASATPVRDTAWIVRATSEAALGGTH
jgi:hypothetical protein